MTVSFKSPVTSPNVNNAYVSRITDTTVLSAITLNNGLSGDIVNNLQVALNKLFQASGVISEDNNSSNDYSEENYIIDGDSYRLAIDKLDQALKVAEQSREALLTLIQQGAILLKEYSSDIEFVNENGDAEGDVPVGSIYYNNVLKTARIFDGVSWISLDFKFFIKKETPTGLVDGSNKEFETSLLPVSADSIDVYLDGLLQKEYTADEDKITFANAPVVGQEIFISYITQGLPPEPIIVKDLKIEYINITSGDVDNKFAYLGDVPLGDVAIDFYGNGFLIDGIDFDIVEEIDDGTQEPTGAYIIEWEGKPIDGTITDGDVLRAIYMVRL